MTIGLIEFIFGVLAAVFTAGGGYAVSMHRIKKLEDSNKRAHDRIDALDKEKAQEIKRMEEKIDKIDKDLTRLCGKLEVFEEKFKNQESVNKRVEDKLEKILNEIKKC